MRKYQVKINIKKEVYLHFEAENADEAKEFAKNTFLKTNQKLNEEMVDWNVGRPIRVKTIVKGVRNV